MDRSALTRIATITAIIAVISLLIAAVIGAASGAFRAMTEGEAGYARGVTVDERKTLDLTDINHIVIRTVSENMTIRETSGNDITAWFHGRVRSSSREYQPHLNVSQHGDTAEIRIERHRHSVIGWTDGNLVLEVDIPKQYAGKLSVESISADITLESRKCSALVLKTVSGDIQADLAKASTGSVDVRSISGDVRLGTPSNAAFSLDAESTSGDVTCDFPITLTGSRTGGGEHHLSGTVGSGRGTVKVRTVSGDIAITRVGGA